MFILGLTGPTGAGKSLAARHLRSRGFSHIDADKAARAVVEPDSPCLKKLAEVFGQSILQPDGSLNRKRLAELAFANGRVDELNAATHPFIMEYMKSEITALEKEGKEFAVLDAPALFESGADKLCNCVMAVTASRRIRISRIIERDGITAEQATARVNAQPAESFYTEKSRYVVSSDEGEKVLFKAVDAAADEIIGMEDCSG